MDASYDVRIWKTEVYKGEKTTTYKVRWVVAGRAFKESFKTATLADSFRSELVSAARRGEAFDVESGRPVSMRRASLDMSWYRFAVKFADMKWPRVAGTTRRTHAEALTKITVAMISTTRGEPDAALIRRALNRWAFNPNRRNDPSCPLEVQSSLRWLEGNTRPVSAIAKREVLRPVLDSLTVRLDGRPAAASVVNRQRRFFGTAAEYAVELKILAANPIPALKWNAPKTSLAVDRRAVANPVQVRTLLEVVRAGRSGERLVAFFGCLYFAALRPEEAVGLCKHNLALPERGWGELHLDEAEPFVGKEWTDTGTNRERRQLKQRAVGEGRTDLRHAGISSWLTAGIPPADAARWAGHSIEILFRIYAAWLSNQSQVWRNKIDEMLGHG